MAELYPLAQSLAVIMRKVFGISLHKKMKAGAQRAVQLNTPTYAKGSAMTPNDFQQMFPAGEENTAYTQYFIGTSDLVHLPTATPLRSK